MCCLLYDIQSAFKLLPDKLYFVPPCLCQIAVMKDRRFENPQTANLSHVVEDTITIQHVLLELKKTDLANTQEVTLEEENRVGGV